MKSKAQSDLCNIPFRVDMACVTPLRITAAYHLFDYLLHVGPLVGLYLFPVIIPPACSMVDKYLSKAVASVFRRGVKQ
jgi:hypothetical protein